MSANRMLKVNALGVGMNHPAGFYITRPRGSGDYLFIHFLTHYRITLGNRIHLNKPGDCIIYAPRYAQEYGSDGVNIFCNDWVHFSGPGIPSLLASFNLTPNTLFMPADASFISRVIDEMNLELTTRGQYWEVSNDLLIRRLLLELSRSVNGQTPVRLSPRDERNQERMNRFRIILQERCTENWSLQRMAEQMMMSKTSFSYMYRYFYKKSPINDLIDMRITMAKRFLSSTDKTVAEISYHCGFSDVYYFCRQFKAKTKQTPNAYRKSAYADPG